MLPSRLPVEVAAVSGTASTGVRCGTVPVTPPSSLPGASVVPFDLAQDAESPGPALGRGRRHWLSVDPLRDLVCAAFSNPVSAPPSAEVALVDEAIGEDLGVEIQKLLVVVVLGLSGAEG